MVVVEVVKLSHCGRSCRRGGGGRCGGRSISLGGGRGSRCRRGRWWGRGLSWLLLFL